MSTVSGITNLVVGTEWGNVKVYGYPLLTWPFDELTAHCGEVTQVCVSPDAKFVFTGGSDGAVFIYSVTEYANETEVFKPTVQEEKKLEAREYRNLIVDENLADVVLIKWGEMEEWTKKQEQLKNEMEDAQHKLESSVTEIKNWFAK